MIKSILNYIKKYNTTCSISGCDKYPIINKELCEFHLNKENEFHLNKEENKALLEDYIYDIYSNYSFKNNTEKLLYIKNQITNINKFTCHNFFIYECLELVNNEFDLCKNCTKNSIIINNDPPQNVKRVKFKPKEQDVFHEHNDNYRLNDFNKTLQEFTW